MSAQEKGFTNSGQSKMAVQILQCLHTRWLWRRVHQLNPGSSARAHIKSWACKQVAEEGTHTDPDTGTLMF